jgi:hypothetical protein
MLLLSLADCSEGISPPRRRQWKAGREGNAPPSHLQTVAEGISLADCHGGELNLQLEKCYSLAIQVIVILEALKAVIAITPCFIITIDLSPKFGTLAWSFY